MSSWSLSHSTIFTHSEEHSKDSPMTDLEDKRTQCPVTAQALEEAFPMLSASLTLTKPTRDIPKGMEREVASQKPGFHNHLVRCHLTPLHDTRKCLKCGAGRWLESKALEKSFDIVTRL